MKKYWKIFGVAAILAGIVYYPVIKLYQFFTNQKSEESDEEDLYLRTFSPTFEGKHSNFHNGDSNTNLS